jgi:hypothetical protein
MGRFYRSFALSDIPSRPVEYPGRSLGKKVEEGFVDFVGVGPPYVVWPTVNLDEPDVLHEGGKACA